MIRRVRVHRAYGKVCPYVPARDETSTDASLPVPRVPRHASSRFSLTALVLRRSVLRRHLDLSPAHQLCAFAGGRHRVITQLLRYLKNTNFHFNFPLTVLSRAPKYKVNFLIIPAVSRAAASTSRTLALRRRRRRRRRFDIAIVFRQAIGQRCTLAEETRSPSGWLRVRGNSGRGEGSWLWRLSFR